jgi:hypothetical protein
MKETTHTNALINETSPYLLQHAHNPVQWYPWGEAALARARAADKPILLSIGYSACHWCHVMAHESFEDETTAKLMNAHFINIKVDREERPDLDKIYQTAQQLLTHRTGGWPLTMFLTPDDQIPFFGGTYFPPEPRYGMPGFPGLLERVATYYRTEQEAIQRQNQSMQEALQVMAQPQETDDESGAQHPLETAVNELAQSFDSRHGGFGGAPKFPHPPNLDLLLRVADSPRLCGDPAPLDDMLRLTLQKMAEGGIYDQLAGGFCRYSVDDHWLIPHFEKMLYDNGQLLCIYSDGWQRLRDPATGDTADGIAAWVMNEMQAADGGYFSSLDADSEGHEGRFYVWDPEQVRALLTEEEFAVCRLRFGLDKSANFEGQWHFFVAAGVDAIAAATGHSADDTAMLLQTAIGKLLQARARRVRPATDDKVLTSWNGLMIKGMARAALRMDRPEWGQSAARALDFIRTTLWRDGRLLATCRGGKAHLAGYLDDHAAMLDATLALLQWQWSDAWLGFAMDLAAALLRQFEDPEQGGFFFTAHDHEQLIQRRKDFMDDAVPSGNAIAVGGLLALGHLVGDENLVGAAERAQRAAGASLLRIPHAHGALLCALMDLIDPPLQIILRGPATEIANWQRQCADNLPLRARLFAIPDSAGPLPSLLAERKPGAGVIAYVCEGFACDAPMTNMEDLLARIKAISHKL